MKMTPRRKIYGNNFITPNRRKGCPGNRLVQEKIPLSIRKAMSQNLQEKTILPDNPMEEIEKQLNLLVPDLPMDQLMDNIIGNIDDLKFGSPEIRSYQDISFRCEKIMQLIDFEKMPDGQLLDRYDEFLMLWWIQIKNVKIVVNQIIN